MTQNNVISDGLPAMASEKIYFNPTYNLSVICKDVNRPMESFVFEDGDYGVEVAMAYIFMYLWLTDCYDPTTQVATVYDAQAMIDWRKQTPKNGVHYDISDIDKPRRNDTLKCSLKQLTPGDVFLSWRKRQTGDVDRDASVTVVTGHETWLNWDMDQGYYRFNIIDGDKWKAFKRDPEAVAVWVSAANCWHWKGE